MNKKELHKRLIEIAAQSPANKRKVGAAVVLMNVNTSDYHIVTDGWNFNLDGGPCELPDGSTHPNVQHAEVTAINEYLAKLANGYEFTSEYVAILFTTHDPCTGCLAVLDSTKDSKYSITGYEVVGEFMKFDTTKPRFDLVPPSAIQALADVLTYGAKKYKPNNWRNVDNPDRYIAAAMRHVEAYRSGQEFDEESGLHHLSHAMTNLAFLLELEYVPETKYE